MMGTFSTFLGSCITPCRSNGGCPLLSIVIARSVCAGDNAIFIPSCEPLLPCVTHLIAPLTLRQAGAQGALLSERDEESLENIWKFAILTGESKLKVICIFKHFAYTKNDVILGRT